MKLKRGILYLSLHNQLVKRFGVNREVEKKEIYAKLGRHFMIPKNLRELTIKEMEEKGLITQENNNKIIILPLEIDIEKDCNKLYKKAGMF